jgi:hypothetical protein
MIRIPENVVKQLPAMTKRIMHAFRRRIKGCRRIGYLNLPGSHRLPVVVSEFMWDRGPRKNILAAYCADNDILYAFRSMLKVFRYIPAGAMSKEHWILHCLAHEVAHALDRARIMRMPQKLSKSHSHKASIRYVQQATEFDAEIAAIKSVDVPFLKRNKNWVIVLASYLSSCYPHIRCWNRTRLARQLIRELESEIIKNGFPSRKAKSR